ncbi:PKD domain-containing protein [Candidatus Bipolaricaulota bacterium]
MAWLTFDMLRASVACLLRRRTRLGAFTGTNRRVVRRVAGLIVLGLAAVSLAGCWPFNDPPVAAFTAAPLVGRAPLTVAVSASAAFDPDGAIVQFAWEFGDGSVGVGENASRVYAEAGTYTVTLRVTDDDGEVDSSQAVLIILPPLPPNEGGGGVCY